MLKKLISPLTKKNNCPDEVILDNLQPQLTFEQQIKVLLWGDKKLGVTGLKGRFDKTDRLIRWVLVLSVVNALTMLEHLTNSEPSSGMFSKLLIKITSLIIGG